MGERPRSMPCVCRRMRLQACGAWHGRPERKEWTAAEDKIIKEGVLQFGCKWRRIAAQLPGAPHAHRPPPSSPTLPTHPLCAPDPGHIG